MHHQDLLHLVRDALSKGATQLSQMSYEWDIAADCHNPQTTLRAATPSEGNSLTYGWEPGKPQTLSILLHTRCRKCEACLEQRRILWTGRALGELRWAPRTWFCSFTLSADNQYLALMRAQARYTRKGYNWDELSPDRQLVARHESIQGELTKWFKRLRNGNKETGTAPHAFRYLLVMEAHKSGLPHYHALIHEMPGDTITWADLDQAGWDRYGFKKYKLATPSRAFYIAKYLAKSSAARVRASLHYGKDPALRIALPVRKQREIRDLSTTSLMRGDYGGDTPPSRAMPVASVDRN